MTELLENYWEAHHAIFRHKDEIGKSDLSQLLKKSGEAFKDSKPVQLAELFPSAKKIGMKQPASRANRIKISLCKGKWRQT